MARQASVGRTWRITRKPAGTYASCVDTSSPRCFKLPPQLGQHQLQMLDLGGARRQLGAQMRRTRYALCRPDFARPQHGLQGSDIVGQEDGVEHVSKFTRTTAGLHIHFRVTPSDTTPGGQLGMVSLP